MNTTLEYYYSHYIDSAKRAQQAESDLQYVEHDRTNNTKKKSNDTKRSN